MENVGDQALQSSFRVLSRKPVGQSGLPKQGLAGPKIGWVPGASVASSGNEASSRRSSSSPVAAGDVRLCNNQLPVGLFLVAVAYAGDEIDLLSQGEGEMREAGVGRGLQIEHVLDRQELRPWREGQIARVAGAAEAGEAGRCHRSGRTQGRGRARRCDQRAGHVLQCFEQRPVERVAAVEVDAKENVLVVMVKASGDVQAVVEELGVQAQFLRELILLGDILLLRNEHERAVGVTEVLLIHAAIGGNGGQAERADIPLDVEMGAPQVQIVETLEVAEVLRRVVADEIRAVHTEPCFLGTVEEVEERIPRAGGGIMNADEVEHRPDPVVALVRVVP